jgi:hypothetical protein
MSDWKENLLMLLVAFLQVLAIALGVLAILLLP